MVILSGLDWNTLFAGFLCAGTSLFVQVHCSWLVRQNYSFALSAKRPPWNSGRPGGAHPVWHIRASFVLDQCDATPLLSQIRPPRSSLSCCRYLCSVHCADLQRAVVNTVDNQGYRDALRLQHAGVQVLGIYDARPGAGGPSVDAARAAGIPVRFRATVLDTASNAEGALHTVTIQDLDTNETFQTVADLLAVSGGWTPIVDLATHIGIKPHWSGEHAAFLVSLHRPAPTPACWPATSAATTINRIFGPAPIPSGLLPALTCNAIHLHDRTCRRSGLKSIEHIKRYTTIGTAHDQGKTSGMLTIGALCQLNGVAQGGKSGLSPADVGTLSFRPPYVPVPFAALAGRERGLLSDPIRITPLHQWHVEAGAVFEDVGQWKRPWYFPKPGERMEDAVRRECVAARQGVAVMDASTLGKIDIQGPDAAVFLDRIYTNMFSTLPEGQCRYGLMCTADGIVFDDGVTTRRDESFLMTTNGGLPGCWLAGTVVATEWQS